VNVDAIDVDGIWWRQTPHGGDPLFRADPPSDGRWQRGETVCGLYFADSEQTAWAEWYRALSEFALPPDRQISRDRWRWHIDIERSPTCPAAIAWLRSGSGGFRFLGWFARPESGTGQRRGNTRSFLRHVARLALDDRRPTVGAGVQIASQRPGAAGFPTPRG